MPINQSISIFIDLKKFKFQTIGVVGHCKNIRLPPKVRQFTELYYYWQKRFTCVQVYEGFHKQVPQTQIGQRQWRKMKSLATQSHPPRLPPLLQKSKRQVVKRWVTKLYNNALSYVHEVVIIVQVAKLGMFVCQRIWKKSAAMHWLSV